MGRIAECWFFLSFISVAMFHAGFRNRCLVDENFLLFRNFKMKNYDFHVWYVINKRKLLDIQLSWVDFF